MKKSAFKWVLSTLGVVSISFSLILMFYGTAKATCTVNVTCPSGGIVSCSGDTCQSSAQCVTCRSHGNPDPISSCCGGGDN